MPRSIATKLSLVALASSVTGCEDELAVEPDFEWQGDRIDIVGFDTRPEDTCAGTFAYLDDFAEATAQEFGVAGHLGTYRWYSLERFASDHPCSATVWGCAGSNGIFTRIMPLEHEVVHLVNNHVVACPSVISEGLAEFFGTSSETPSSSDVTELIMQSEHGSIAPDDYPLAGAFTAHLVESYGLDAVLNLCQTSGPYPSLEEFSAAAQTSFGVSLGQILLEFAEFDCVYSEYRSKHFECSKEPDLILGAEGGEIDLEIGCQSPTTIGPRERWLPRGRPTATGSAFHPVGSFGSLGIPLPQPCLVPEPLDNCRGAAHARGCDPAGAGRLLDGDRAIRARLDRLVRTLCVAAALARRSAALARGRSRGAGRRDSPRTAGLWVGLGLCRTGDRPGCARDRSLRPPGHVWPGVNLSLLMRQLFGVGTPRSLQGSLAAFLLLLATLLMTIVARLWAEIGALARRWGDRDRQRSARHRAMSGHVCGAA